MLGSWITLVPVEPVAGKVLVPGIHQAVTKYLRQDGSSRDSRFQPVTLDNGSHFAFHLWSVVSIDQRKRRKRCQTFQGPAHSQQGRLQYVDLVYFIDAYFDDGPGKGSFLDLKKQHLTFPGAEFLGIIQAGDNPERIKNDCSDDYRASEGAATCLVYPGS
jgi:hypothetical protein